jgi:hypothetical protein
MPPMAMSILAVVAAVVAEAEVAWVIVGSLKLLTVGRSSRVNFFENTSQIGLTLPPW